MLNIGFDWIDPDRNYLPAGLMGLDEGLFIKTFYVLQGR
jgi:hypothetical protein